MAGQLSSWSIEHANALICNLQLEEMQGSLGEGRRLNYSPGDSCGCISDHQGVELKAKFGENGGH